jgi:hypothetical protein
MIDVSDHFEETKVGENTRKTLIVILGIALSIALILTIINEVLK